MFSNKEICLINMCLININFSVEIYFVFTYNVFYGCFFLSILTVSTTDCCPARNGDENGGGGRREGGGGREVGGGRRNAVVFRQSMT